MAQVDSVSNLTSRNQHVIAIDLVRFLAAALVLLSHLAFSIGARPDSRPYELSGGTMPQALLPGLSFYGWIGVQVFFVVSGIVIAYSAHGATPYAFFRSRVLRLVPAAWLCTTLIFVVLLWHHGALTTDLLRGFRHSMLFMPWDPWIDYAFWTLGVEISFYTAVGVLIYRRQLRSIGTLASVLAWVCLLYWLLFSLGQWGGGLPELAILRGKLPYFAERVLELLLVKHGSFFAAGIYIWAVFIDRRSGPAWWNVAATLAACVLEVYWTNVYANGPRTNPWWPAMAIGCGSVAMILAGIRYNAELRSNATVVRVLRTLGLMTYPLYLLHQSIGSVVIGQLRLTGVEPVAALCIATLLVMALSWSVVSYAEPALKSWMGEAMDFGRARLIRMRA